MTGTTEMRKMLGNNTEAAAYSVGGIILALLAKPIVSSLYCRMVEAGFEFLMHLIEPGPKTSTEASDIANCEKSASTVGFALAGAALGFGVWAAKKWLAPTTTPAMATNTQRKSM